MHFTRITPLVFALIALSILGCSTRTRSEKSISVTSIYIESPVSFGNFNIEKLNPTVVETAAGELRSHGYTVTQSPGEAQAILRGTWRTSENINSALKDDVGVSLSMSLFTKAGQKIYSSDSGSSVPLSFWNAARTATTVDNILSSLPVASTSAK